MIKKVLSVLIVFTCLLSIVFLINKRNSNNDGIIEKSSELSISEDKKMTNPEKEEIKIVLNGKSFDINFEDNIFQLISELPLNINMKDLNENEKYFYLDSSLEKQEEDIKQIKAGDVMLFGDNCLVIFYKDLKQIIDIQG